MTAAPTDDLFPEARNPQGTVAINDRCVLRIQDGHCVLLVSGMVLAQYAVTDRMAQAHAMVSLVEQGWADQIEVARAFHCTVRTVRRQQRRFEDSGLAGLGQGRGYHWYRDVRLEQYHQALRNEGVEIRWAAELIHANKDFGHALRRRCVLRLNSNPADLEAKLGLRWLNQRSRPH